MFDDLETAERRTDRTNQSGTSVGLERWAHFPALAVFGLLILPLQSDPWGWQIAIAAGYTVYVFWFALGSGAKDLDDLLGDSRSLQSAARLLLPHLLALALVIFGVTWWFRLRPLLPDGLTHEGRRGSFWDLIGWLVLALAAIAQGSWMARKINRSGRDQEN